MNQIMLFYVPMPDKIAAENLACDLLEKKMISCANVVDAGSLYIFEGKFSKDNEVLLLIKTFVENKDAVLAYIETEHPYEVPLIAHYFMNVNDAYFNWMKKELQN